MAVEGVLFTARILTVDDSRSVRYLVRHALEQDGEYLFTVLEAENGKEAIRFLSDNPPDSWPDLILLDRNMPVMSGDECIQLIKSSEQWRAIPVLFLTANKDVQEVVHGMSVLKADDYLAKPFHADELLARIKALLRVKQAEDQLRLLHAQLNDSYLQVKEQYDALQEMEQLRRDVDAITRHDLKSPIDGILGCTEILISQYKTLSRESLCLFVELIRDSARQLREMVNLSLNLIKMEQGTYAVTLQPTDLVPIIRRVRSDNQKMVDRKNLESLFRVENRMDHPEARFIVLGDATLCYTMIANLYRNALEASENGQRVTLSLERGEICSVTIHNAGVVPKEMLANFFKKYATHGKKGGTGLGTYSARLMAQTQQGDIQVRSSEAEGTTLTITLCSVPEEQSG
ncbi:MAG: hybrid sensor histidine kinase/response regulator [Magnetococcus sp. YQC-5]